MIYTIYYIIEDNNFYTFSSIQITKDSFNFKNPSEHIPKYGEYCGYYPTGSSDSFWAKDDIQHYCNQRNNPSQYGCDY
jgi:hypothetical protein